MNKSQSQYFLLTVLTWAVLGVILVYHQFTGTESSHPSGALEPAVAKPLPKAVPAGIIKQKKAAAAASDADHSYSSKVEKSQRSSVEKTSEMLLKKELRQDALARKKAAQERGEVHQPRVVEDYKQRMSWQDFAQRPIEPYSTTRMEISEETKNGLLVCPQEVVDRLTKRLSDEDFKWCQWALSDQGGRVKVGKSYGTLNGPQRDKYEQLNCNAVAQGQNPACDDSWGDAQITSWKRKKTAEMCANSPEYTSRITCRESRSLARACVFDNALLDFSKLTNVKRPGRSDTRKWDAGFIGTHCDANLHQHLNYYHFIAPTAVPPATTTRTAPQCDYVLNRTVVIYGHDDAKNLGHTMSDFMNVWAMLWLAGLGTHAKDLVFLNTDAIREGHNYYDELGALQTHYDKQFHSVLKAHDFYSQDRPRVCVKRLLVQPQPVILFTWDGWWQDMKCSFVGPSSLFQRWNVQIRHIYGLLPGMEHAQDAMQGLSTPQQSGVTRVLLVKRVVSKRGAAPMYTSRVIANFDAVVDTLQTAFRDSKVEIIVQDLAVLSFEAQVRLVASVDILVGIHGAGIPSAMHMSIGQRPACCGVLEIFPQGEFAPIRGYGNMARRMGLRYERWALEGRASGSHGVTLPVDQVVQKVQSLMVPGSKATAAEAGSGGASCILPSVLEDPFFDSVPM